MIRCPLLFILVASFSFGCVRYSPQSIDPARTAAIFSGRSLHDAGLHRFLATQGAGGSRWNVDRLALAAAYFHGDVAVARAESEEAAAGIKVAGESPNPVLSFAPGYNASSVGISPWIITPSIEIPIETAGKRGKRIAEARAFAEAAKLRIAAAGWLARTKVRAAMLDLYAAQETATLLAAELALHEEVVTKLNAQVQAGASSAFELLQERLGLNRSKLALHDAQKLAATSRAQLAAAVGVAPGALDGVPLDFSDFASLPSVPASGLRRRALTHRADLLAALADYAAADAGLRLQVAKQYPDVHLNPGYELDQTENKVSLGMTLELPILNRNRGPIAQAVAHRKTVGTRFEAKQQAVFGEIETALAAYRAARAKAATATTLSSEASQASETTRRMVEAGELVPIELTRRRIEASAANLSRLDARIEAQQAAGALEAAIHIPLRRAAK
jgi:outer membrane protein TolC